MNLDAHLPRAEACTRSPAAESCGGSQYSRARWIPRCVHLSLSSLQCAPLLTVPVCTPSLRSAGRAAAAARRSASQREAEQRTGTTHNREGTKRGHTTCSLSPRPVPSSCPSLPLRFSLSCTACGTRRRRVTAPLEQSSGGGAHKHALTLATVPVRLVCVVWPLACSCLCRCCCWFPSLLLCGCGCGSQWRLHTGQNKGRDTREMNNMTERCRVDRPSVANSREQHRRAGRGCANTLHRMYKATRR